MSIEKYIADIIKREGGFVDNPNDRGGPTKFGITIATLADYRKGGVTRDDVSSMQVEEAYKIYKENYLDKPGISNISDSKLQALMLDTAVHSGPVQAIKFLQNALHIGADGIIGAITIQMMNNYPRPDEIRRKYLSLRIQFIGNLITKNPSQAEFAGGWAKRMGELLETLI